MPRLLLIFRSFLRCAGVCAAILAGGAGAASAATLNSGDLVVSDAGTSAATSLITRVEPATGTRSTITGAGVGSGASFDTALRTIISATGTIYYLESVDPTNLQKLVALDPATGARTVIGGSAFTAVTSIAWDPSTAKIIVSDAGTAPSNSSIIRVDPANGARVTITGNGAGSGASFDTAQFIACSAAGTIYYFESADATNLRRLVSVDPATGARTLIGGAAFTAVTGLVWDSSTSTIIVADAGTAPVNSAIIRVNPADGARTTITGNGTGSGVSFDTASAIAASDSGTIYYHESVDGTNFRRLVSVNPANGARALVPGSAFTSVTSFVVVPASLPPPVTIETVALANWTQNRPGYSQTIVASGGTGAKTFAVTVGVPPTGLSLNTTTGELAGTPTITGAFNFTITATDTVGASAAQAYTVVINPPVAITTLALASWTQDRPGYSQTIIATGGTGAKTFAVTAGNLPPGLPLNAATGGITGTPTAAGTFNFTVTATDTVGATGSRAYSIIINPGVVITTAALSDWTVNRPGYSQNITATGGTGAKTFAVSAGTLPNGLTLSGAGVLSGMPTATGSFDFTVTATDTVGASGSRAYTVVINSSVTITTAALSNWGVNSPGYNQTVVATGGTGAKTFAVTAGALPDGLALNAATGAITGTPTAAGVFNLTITATDTVGATGSRAFSITINQANATVTLGHLTQPYTGSPRPVSVATSPDGLAVNVTYNGEAAAPTLPGSYAVVATIADPNYTGFASGTLVITITALVRHAPTINSGFDGSLQMLTGENVILAGDAWISGDLLVPGTPTVTLSGIPTYAGTLDAAGAAQPTGYTISLNDTALLRNVVRRVDPLSLPTVNAPPAPVGTRTVVLNSAGDDAGDFATLRNLTLNGKAGSVAVPPGTYGNLSATGNNAFVLGVAGSAVPAIYNLQKLSLAGNAELQVVGPVILTLASGGTFNSNVGSAIHPEWLVLRIATGGLTSTRKIAINASVIAPNGTIYLDGMATMNGIVVCDQLTLEGNSLIDDPNL